jgi:glycyl-tRNA synthetase beta chain
MPELLLELGCEELPASFVRKAFTDLEQAVASRLKAEEVSFEPGNPPIGTPRRLIVHFKNVAERQPDRVKEARGPSVAAAFDVDGRPTKALEGFCRAQDVRPEDARREGDYVWISKRIPGKPTLEILQTVLPDAIRSLSFEKSMRWGGARMRFARPIRWILASFGESAVSFDVEGVASGMSSRGHRFDHPEPFEARTYDQLVDGLIARKVEPDPEERAKRIREGAVVLATGEPLIEPGLLEENVFLTEWPTPLEGQFKEEYLELPDSVLMTAMAKHEKMFPVKGRDGKLINRFVFVRNSGEDETVRAGAEWVLNARFNDAKFFFDEDLKRRLADFLEATSGILFQETLGTIRQRAERLASLAAEIARRTPVHRATHESEVELARQAGLYAKADLASGLVSELASLQGIVGGDYARREGFPEAVCEAIAGQYDLKRSLNGGLVRDEAGARTSVRLLVTDAMDKLAGYLGLGLTPSGSSDPFGLRRAATSLLEAAWAWPAPMGSYLGEMLDAALGEYAKQGHAFDRASLSANLRDVLEGRYESELDAERPDLVEATKAWADEPQKARSRLETLKLLVSDREFVQTATRPINILDAAVLKGQFDPARTDGEWPSKLNSPEGSALLDAANKAKSALETSEGSRARADVLLSLEKPINDFFEAAMVMDENPETRQARLELVRFVSDVLKNGGDFSKVVLEGA